MLRNVGLTEMSLGNPTFFYVPEPFAAQPREILHKLLWDCKEPIIALFQTKSITGMHEFEIMNARVNALRHELRSSMAPRPLDTVACMKGYEFQNLLSVSFLVTDSVIPATWDQYLWLTNALHWFLNSSSISIPLLQHVVDILSKKQLEALQQALPAVEFETMAQRSKRLHRETIRAVGFNPNDDDKGHRPAGRRKSGRRASKSKIGEATEQQDTVIDDEEQGGIVRSISPDVLQPHFRPLCS